MRLSKSRFITGLQCHRLLWWSVHERDAPELVPGVAQRGLMNGGQRVGEVAREYVPGGVLIDRPHVEIAERVHDTRVALESGAAVIYEAAFVAEETFVAVDILHRGGGGWTLTEVKSTTSAKDAHKADVALQTYVLRSAGVPVRRAEVMHLNRACRYPDLSTLFTRTDVTDDVAGLLPTVRPEIRRQLRMLGDASPPPVKARATCAGQDCPFLTRCHGERPAHSVETLYGLGARRRRALEESGYETIDAIPDEHELPGVAARQRRAVVSGELVVEAGLAAALAGFEAPVAHLDFETIAPAIPVWPGCRPYDAVPVQFSVHVETGEDELRHHEFLAEDGGDPREALARALVEAVRGARTVVVYSAGFERGRLRELCEAVPHLAPELEDVIARLRDLLPVVREHVYHPDFDGSFGLKSVAPALTEDVDYEDLEVAGGHHASAELERVILRGDALSEGERRGIREGLLRYCARDTLGTVGVLRVLRGLGTRP